VTACERAARGSADAPLPPPVASSPIAGSRPTRRSQTDRALTCSSARSKAGPCSAASRSIRWWSKAFKARGVSLFLLDLNGGADDVSNGIVRLFLTIVTEADAAAIRAAFARGGELSAAAGYSLHHQHHPGAGACPRHRWLEAAASAAAPDCYALARGVRAAAGWWSDAASAR